MNRSIFTLLGALGLGVALFASSYFAGQRACQSCVMQPTDELDWLRKEFHLSDAEMARVRKLHEGYLPKCGEMCQKIAAKRREVEESMTGATNLTAAAEQKITDLHALRAQCQAQMLRHFIEVSQAMPAEQGQRYLAEMKRITLGTQEQMEKSMSESPGHAHGQP